MPAIDRRTFLHQSAALGALASIPRALAADTPSVAPESPPPSDAPLVSFLFACDAHLGIPGDVAKPAALRRLIAEINARRFTPRPDFLFLGGDNVNGGQEQLWDQANLPGPLYLLNQQRELATILAELDPAIPLRMIPHTHDIKIVRPYVPAMGAITSDHGAAYRAAFGDEPWPGTTGQPDHAKTHFHWTHGNLLFVAFGNDGEVMDYSPETIAWLEATLSRPEFSAHQKILFGHVPAIPIGGKTNSARAAILALAARHRALAMFTGHSHRVATHLSDGTDARVLTAENSVSLTPTSGLIHVEGGSLGYGDAEFAHVLIYADRLEYTRHRVEGTAIGWRTETQRGTEPERAFTLRGLALHTLSTNA
jgi:hypothetical protein